jgi:hypothetical protein
MSRASREFPIDTDGLPGWVKRVLAKTDDHVRSVESLL